MLRTFAVVDHIVRAVPPIHLNVAECLGVDLDNRYRRVLSILIFETHAPYSFGVVIVPALVDELEDGEIAIQIDSLEGRELVSDRIVTMNVQQS